MSIKIYSMAEMQRLLREGGFPLEAPVINNPEINQPTINSPEINSPEINSPEINSPEINGPITGDNGSDVLSDADQTITSASAWDLVITPSTTRTLKWDNSFGLGASRRLTNADGTNVAILTANDDSEIGRLQPGETTTLKCISASPADDGDWSVLGPLLVDVSGGADRGRVPVVLHSDTTEVGNVGSGEDDLMSYTLPGGTLAKDGEAVIIEGLFKGNHADNCDIKLHFGSSSILSIDNRTISSNGETWVKVTVVRTGTSAQIMTSFGFEGITNTLFGQGESPTEDLTSDIVVKFTGQNVSDTSSNAVVQTYMNVEFRPVAP